MIISSPRGPRRRATPRFLGARARPMRSRARRSRCGAMMGSRLSPLELPFQSFTTTAYIVVLLFAIFETAIRPDAGPAASRRARPRHSAPALSWRPPHQTDPLLPPQVIEEREVYSTTPLKIETRY